jgi:hypothetical protein
MDFDLDRRQTELLDRLRAVVGAAAAGAPTVADGSDPLLAAAVAADPVLTGPQLTLLDRVLLVEEAAHLGAAVHATATLLVGPLCGRVVPGPLAIRAGDIAPLRFAEHAVAVVDVRPPTARTAAVVAGSFTAVPSGMVQGYGTVVTAPGAPLAWSGRVEPLDAFRLGRAAEIAGAARHALELTAAYLDRRRQFGRSLSAFQALRHRMSELAVDVEATSALVRTAAFAGTSTAILGAASYAIDTAARLVPELHQMSGARGFTFESGLPACTMAVAASRVELSAAGATPVAFAEATWAS